MLVLGAISLVLTLLVGADSVLNFDSVWYPVHDGVSRVKHIASVEEWKQVIQDSSILVAWFHGEADRGPDVQDTATRSSIDVVHDRMMEVAAQHHEDSSDVHFVSTNMDLYPDIAKHEGVEASGTVLVYKDGRKTLFSGYRSPEVLLSYIQKFGSAIVRTVDSRLTKKEYDHVDTPKVIGYFSQNAPGYQEFEALSAENHPRVPFFAVYNATLAEKLGFEHNQTDVVRVVRPSDNHYIEIPIQSTLDEMRQMISTNSRPVFDHVTLENVHGLSGQSNGDDTLLAFSRRESQEARMFHKALKNTARQFVNHTDLHVIVTDPDLIQMDARFWQKTFSINIEKPCIGLINMSDATSVWFDMAMFDAAPSEAEARLVLEEWFQRIVDKRIRVDGLPPEPEKEIPMAEMPGIAEDAVQEENVVETLKTTGDSPREEL